jgi:hypothetical protein
MSVLVRVDDFPTGSPEGKVWQGIPHLYRAFHEIMRRYDIPYLLGVVPAYVESFLLLDELKQDDGDNLEIGTHGFNHIADDTPYNEYDNKSFERIWCETNNAYDWMERFSPKVYIAPFNRYSNDALRCIEYLYKHVTTGPETAEQDLDFGGLIQIPSHYYGFAHELVPKIQKNGLNEDLCIITLHWTWEMLAIVKDASRLEELCSMITGKAITWREAMDSNMLKKMGAN